MSEVLRLIQQLRAAGITQSAIAAATGIHQSRLSRWEHHGPAAGAEDALKLKAFADSRLGHRDGTPCRCVEPGPRAAPGQQAGLQG